MCAPCKSSHAFRCSVVWKTWYKCIIYRSSPIPPLPRLPLITATARIYWEALFELRSPVLAMVLVVMAAPVLVVVVVVVAVSAVPEDATTVDRTVTCKFICFS